MHILQAIILGIVEGITEFLPISSTGHLIVAEKALGFHDVQDLFTVVVQVGAIGAVVWFFWRDLLDKLVGLLRRKPAAVKFWLLLVVGTVPAGIVGLVLDSSMHRFTTPLVVAIALIIGGVVLWVVDSKPVTKKQPVQEVDIAKVGLKRALLIGLGQCVAIIPGVSRSGATIVTGLVTGLNRPTATAFSFYLSIPVLVLASGLKLVKYSGDLKLIPGGSAALLVGLMTAFVTAFVAVSWLLKYVAHHNFKPFAYYRIALGMLILVLLATGWL